MRTTLGLTFKRIQFTPDLMPTDITGTDIIEEDITTGHRTLDVRARTDLHERAAGGRNQSHAAEDAGRAARSDAGAFGDGARHDACAEPPFFVLATQNPIELEGTYPLPEAQLDRFLFNVLLDYLSAEDEMEVVDRTTTRMQPPQERSRARTPRRS